MRQREQHVLVAQVLRGVVPGVRARVDNARLVELVINRVTRIESGLIVEVIVHASHDVVGVLRIAAAGIARSSSPMTVSKAVWVSFKARQLTLKHKPLFPKVMGAMMFRPERATPYCVKNAVVFAEMPLAGFERSRSAGITPVFLYSTPDPDPLWVSEEKELILDNWTTNRAAKVVARKNRSRQVIGVVVIGVGGVPDQRARFRMRNRASYWCPTWSQRSRPPKNARIQRRNC